MIFDANEEQLNEFRAQAQANAINRKAHRLEGVRQVLECATYDPTNRIFIISELALAKANIQYKDFIK